MIKSSNVESMQLESLFHVLMGVQSDTGTALEKDISDFIFDWLSDLEYYKKNPQLLQKHNISDDPYERSVVWGLVKGTGPNTVILMHHHDAVDIFEYGDLKEYALSSADLKARLMHKQVPQEVYDDLNDPDWIFGRGSCDMKAGAAVQMWLLAKYSDCPELLKGNILLLSVPDEENLSAGMREAITLMNDLREKYSLNYVSAINSEPVAVTAEKQPIFYEGTVGKIMPIIYARGKKSHVGDVFSGFNPVWLLSKMHTDIELSFEFSDHCEGEVTPPPTWVYFRDQKMKYDASLPESAVAYFSVLTLDTTPGEIIEKLKGYAERSFTQCIEKYRNSVNDYNMKSKEKVNCLSIEPRVLTFDELYTILIDHNGPMFAERIESRSRKLHEDVVNGSLSLQESTVDIINYMLTFLPDHEPIIVIAFSGPFYPHVTNKNSEKAVRCSFKDIVNAFTEKHWGYRYESKKYFMGISDFSYTSFSLEEHDIDSVKRNVPGWGILYGIPIEGLKKLDIPVINLGPWGKDLHKITERVHRIDAFHRIPKIIEHVIDSILDINAQNTRA